MATDSTDLPTESQHAPRAKSPKKSPPKRHPLLKAASMPREGAPAPAEVVRDSRTTSKSEPLDASEEGAVIAHGEPMEPATTWRARRLRQRLEYQALAAERRLSQDAMGKRSLAAVLLGGLSSHCDEGGPIVNILAAVRLELDALARICDENESPLGSILDRLERQLTVAIELLERADEGGAG